MLGRNIEGEMARIAERGSEHAAAAWLRIANHAEQPEQQLQAHQQAGSPHSCTVATCVEHQSQQLFPKECFPLHKVLVL